MSKITTKPALLATAKRAIEIKLQFQGFDVVLIPKKGDSVAKPGGGHDFAGATPRAAQRVSLSRLGNDNIQDASSDDGQVIYRNYLLTGRLDMEIAEGDSWEDDEARFVVASFDQSSGFKTTADVVGHIKLGG